MARPVNNGAILEVIVDGRSSGQTVLSVFHYRLSSAAAGVDGTGLVTSLDGMLNAVGGLVDKYLDCCAVDYLPLKISYQWIFPVRYTSQRLTPFAAAGNIAEILLPANVAMCLVKRTFLTGRTQRGVLHMPGVPVTFVDNSQVSGIGRAAYQALADSVDNTLTLATNEVFTPVIFHRADPALSPTIEVVEPESTSRIMRRRSFGLGV